MNFVFFGSDQFSIAVLEELLKAGYSPALVVTVPDQPKGRGLVLTPPPIKPFAMSYNIPALQPKNLNDAFNLQLKTYNLQLFIVASYGKIIPKPILNIPEKGALNVHPSLLPKFRGPSPVESAILADEKNTGVTIMLMDEKMDHGPIVAQKKAALAKWPPKASELEETLAKAGGKLLAEILPDWLAGKITPVPQNESKATYCRKFEKKDGLLDISADPYKNLLKIRAFEQFPGTYFFAKRGAKTVRVTIKEADFENGRLVLRRVAPEGKREMDYAGFLRGLQSSKTFKN